MPEAPYLTQDWLILKPIALFAYDMILYLENPKDATRKVLELIN